MGAPRFSVDECRAVAIHDAETGKLIVGAEDLSFGNETNHALVLSAYDRLSNVEGAVYTLEPSELTKATAKAKSIGPWTHPHGLYAGRTVEIITRINHEPHYVFGILSTFADRDEAGGRTPPRQSVVWDGASPLPCGANDLFPDTFDGNPASLSTYVTVEREGCADGLVGKAFSGPTGYVIRVEFDLESQTYISQTAAEGFNLANGITSWSDGIWVAEMRGRRMTRLDKARSIDLPGAPDNLNTSAEGIVAALQPSLWRFGLYRYGYAERAPTRIVLVDPETEEIELLFEDLNGRLLSGATAAVLRDDMLIASSVRGEALLVCENKG